MTFRATESSTAPIVLGKEPVPRPSALPRGIMSARISEEDAKKFSGSYVTFTVRNEGFLVTYHRAILLNSMDRIASLQVDDDVVITWEQVAH